MKLKFFGSRSLLATLVLLLFITNSCKKDKFASQSTTGLGKFSIADLPPDKKVTVAEVLNWVGANITPEHKALLQMDKIQQRYVNKHHVIKIPIQDDAALYFTKDSA